MRINCISYPKRDRLLVIRQCYLNICGGSHCSAALLANFEYWHGIRLGQVEQEETYAKSDPEYSPNLSLWVYKRASHLHEDLLGLYGEDAIREGLADLLSRGFIERKQNDRNPFDKTLMYLFKPDLVQSAISGNAAPIPEKSGLGEREDPISVCESSGSLPIREITSWETTSSEKPKPDFSATDGQNEEPVRFAESAMRMWSGTRGLKRLGAGDRKFFLEHWRNIEITENDLRSALDRFAAWLKTADGVRSPLAVFLKDPCSWIGETTAAKTEASEPIRETTSAPAETLPVVQETVETFVASKPPRFRHYIGLFLVAGKEITLPRVKSAWAKWQAHTDEQNEGSIRHAERSFPKTSQQYIPSPDRHMDGEHWTAVQMDRVLPPAPVSGRRDMDAVNASALRIAEARAAARARGELVL